jgi:hypothetical protein
MNDECERTWKETAVNSMRYYSENCLEGPTKNHGKPRQSIAVSIFTVITLYYCDMEPEGLNTGGRARRPLISNG